MSLDERFDQSSHFDFGKNWQNYLTTLTEEKIQNAQISMHDLLSADQLRQSTFLDIGCGSGLHSLCALRSGVSKLSAIDFDPDSVSATKETLKKLWPQNNYEVSQGNVLTLERPEKFDIVYSWGVLHHTGAMWEAIRCASQFVQKDGFFVIAIYQKTWMCGIWKVVKRLYKNLGPRGRSFVNTLFSNLKKLKILLSGQNPNQYIADYNQQRGMNWDHDVIDWLGGYPYESATAEEVISFVENLGFEFIKGRGLNKKMPIGFFGSGCGEFVFKRD